MDRLTPVRFEQGRSEPYYIYDPEVYTEAGQQMDQADILAEMKNLTEHIKNPDNKLVQGHVLRFAGDESRPLGEVLDTGADNLTDGTPTNQAMNGLLVNMAQIAEDVGFDRGRAVMKARLSWPNEWDDVNQTIHSDGLSGNLQSNTEKFQTIRVIYAVGPGTVLYPGLAVSKYDSPRLDSEEGAYPRTWINTVSEINAPAAIFPTDEQLESAEAQQVMPGKILAFDPTQTFWHQAPEGNDRPILVVDVTQASTYSD